MLRKLLIVEQANKTTDPNNFRSSGGSTQRPRIERNRKVNKQESPRARLQLAQDLEIDSGRSTWQSVRYYYARSFGTNRFYVRCWPRANVPRRGSERKREGREVQIKKDKRRARKLTATITGAYTHHQRGDGARARASGCIAV